MKRAKNKSIKSGFFLTLEGIDGVGKSTLFKKLNDYFIDQGYSPVLSREPGGTLLGEKLRRLLAQTPMQPWSEVFLLEASRTENTIENILPALNQKKLVICDRFTDSTLAYQGGGRQLSLNHLQNLNDLATSKLKPDLTILLDSHPEKSLDRAKNPNRIEKEGIEFQKRARKVYLKQAKMNPGRFFLIDVSEHNAQAVFEIARDQILKKMKRFHVTKEK